MIQQKSAEMLFSLKPEKRKLEDLIRVIEQASHAQKSVSITSELLRSVVY